MKFGAQESGKHHPRKSQASKTGPPIDPANTCLLFRHSKFCTFEILMVVFRFTQFRDCADENKVKPRQEINGRQGLAYHLLVLEKMDDGKDVRGWEPDQIQSIQNPQLFDQPIGQSKPAGLFIFHLLHVLLLFFV
ncbi:MAG: hypothetical protein WCP91_02355 [Candidatus Berkelbacteria bacterium]